MSDVINIPFDQLVTEGLSQSNRVVLEVMQKLFDLLPPRDTENSEPTFILADGTPCWLVKFSDPKEIDGVLGYGFDVRFPDSHPLVHLEFRVHKSGWERRCVFAEDAQ